ncbi:MAG: hypothetical protein RLZZ591_2335 [Pseudomonadota bacterium]|jgi:flagellar hook protein FlgE
MSFQTGLSGLNASSRSLDVIGNNIANANTVGAKSSRAEFASIVASSMGAGGGGGAGIGVAVESISQLFTQGSVSITGNDLDLAINGGGFFRLQLPDGTPAFSRAGQFKLDSTGNIVTNAGAKVMGYETTVDGVASSTTLKPLTLPTTAPIAANPTSLITAEFNLDARSDVYNATTNVPARGTYGTAITVFDSQGNEVPFSVAFTRAGSSAASGTVPALDNWDVVDPISGTPILDTNATPPQAIQLKFTSTGSLYSPTTPPKITIATTNSSTTPDITASLDFSKATQFGAAFSVTDLTQDGYPPGSFTGLKISDGGVITASYSNGQSRAEGMIGLAAFRNPQGLAPIGGNNWAQTLASGAPVDGQPGNGQFGTTRAGALEDSNVDLTAELVNMMTAQRAYQANAQTIKTQDQVMSTLVNLR